MSSNYNRLYETLKIYIKSVDEIYMSEGQNQIDIDDLETPGSVKKNPLNNDISVEKFSLFMKELEAIEFEYDVIPYSKISEIIFNTAETELLDSLAAHFEEAWQTYTEKEKPKEKEIKYFLKIKEHIVLSINQKTHISSRLSEKLQDANQQYSKLEIDLKDFEKKIKANENEIQKKYDGIITQFIAVLGIFSAILMGAFGSIQGFTSIYNNAHNLQLGKLLIISALGCMLLVFIIFILMNSIAKLTGYNLSSCKCHKKKKGSLGVIGFLRRTIVGENEECTCSLFEKHPSVVFINYILIFIVMIGFYLMLIVRNPTLYSWTNNAIFTIVAIIISTYMIVRHIIYIHRRYVARTDIETGYIKSLLLQYNKKAIDNEPDNPNA